MPAGAPAPGYAALGDILAAAGRHDEALADYDAAIDLAPERGGVRLSRADVLVEAGRLDDALDDFAQLPIGTPKWRSTASRAWRSCGPRMRTCGSGSGTR